MEVCLKIDKSRIIERLIIRKIQKEMAYDKNSFKDSKNRKGTSVGTPAPSLRGRAGGEAAVLKDGWAADIAEAVRVM